MPNFLTNHKCNFKLLPNFSSQHFATIHQLLRLRQNTFCNQTLKYEAVLDCIEALIAKFHLASKPQ